MRKFFRKLNINKRKIWSVGLVTIIFVMSLGYAALSQHMDIDSVTVIDRNWGVEITSMYGNGGPPPDESYFAMVGTTATIYTKIESSSQQHTIDIILSNQGNLVAKLINIEVIEDENTSIGYTITGITEGQILKPGETNTATVTIKYANGVTNVSDINKSLMITFNYVEDVGNSIQGDGYVPITGQKEYSIGEEVTLVDGSRWYVVEDSGSNEELVTLFAATSDMTCSKFDTNGSNFEYNPSSTTNIGYCLNNSYRSSLVNSINSAGGNAKGLSVRLLTYQEFERFTQNNSAAIQFDKTGQTTWLMPYYYTTYITTTDNKADPLYISDIGSISNGTRPVITVLKSNVLTTLADKILENNTQRSDSDVNFSMPAGTYSSHVSSSTTSVTFTSSTTYYFAQSYSFNPATGSYNLAGGIRSGTWSSISSSYSNYPYTCRGTTTSTTCTTMYKMTGYTNTTTGTGYSYTRKSTTGTIYYNSNSARAQDNGRTYYFRGNTTNNYVSFAGHLWRIVRINEDGGVRLIKQDAPGTSFFNIYSSDNAYVGYMYGTAGSSTKAATHANKNDSAIKEYLDSWYINNLAQYSQYMSTEAGFCNDRGTSSSGYGTLTTPYNFEARIASPSIGFKYPTFKCEQISDLFTTGMSSKGNKTSKYPIGLLTADEVIYAGAADEYTNSSYYLTGTSFWTMTPYIFSGNAQMMLAYLDGSIVSESAATNYAVRPVINLSAGASVIAGGAGTSGNPYVIKTTTETSLVQQVFKNNSPQPDNQASQYVSSSTGINFGAISSSTNGQGLYYTSTNTENNLPTYYFRGNVTSNYVSFAGKVWRIVRINEDGSVRLILNTAPATRAYNSSISDNAHVGYMYGTTPSTTYAEAHANTKSSTIKTYLDSWYTSNLNSVNNYITDAGFCNDRSRKKYSSSDTGLGYGTNYTDYGPRYRGTSSKVPQLMCPSNDDFFTVSLNLFQRGNSALTKPIGLITYDEAMYAGNVYNVASANNYLHIGSSYWTMSPAYFGTGSSGTLYPFAWRMDDTGTAKIYSTNGSHGVRPVINLSNGVQVTSGNGTSSNPYIIKVG